LLTAFFLAGLNPSAEAEVDFQCKIPPYGYGDCTGDHFSVPKGYYVRVKNVSSGGKTVWFRARNVDGDHLLGQSQDAKPGDKVFVWRNDTGRTINIQFEAEASGTVNTVCNARAYITRN